MGLGSGSGFVFDVHDLRIRPGLKTGQFLVLNRDDLQRVQPAMQHRCGTQVSPSPVRHPKCECMSMACI